MKILSFIKNKMKKVAVPVAASAAVVVASASSASAAIVYAAVETAILAAVTDILAGGAILLGAYAGFWGIRKVVQMFARG